MNVRFRAVKDFHSDELQSSYVAGLNYTIRPEDALLAELAPRWADDGLIEYVNENGPAPGAASASGVGSVN